MIYFQNLCVYHKCVKNKSYCTCIFRPMLTTSIFSRILRFFFGQDYRCYYDGFTAEHDCLLYEKWVPKPPPNDNEMECKNSEKMNAIINDFQESFSKAVGLRREVLFGQIKDSKNYFKNITEGDNYDDEK